MALQLLSPILLSIIFSSMSNSMVKDFILTARKIRFSIVLLFFFLSKFFCPHWDLNLEPPTNPPHSFTTPLCCSCFYFYLFINYYYLHTQLSKLKLPNFLDMTIELCITSFFPVRLYLLSSDKSHIFSFFFP